MPALKVRIPHVDRAALPEGPLARTSKEALSALLATPAHAHAPVFLPPSLPSESVTIWVSDEQYAQLQSIATQHRFDGAGPAAAALLHAAAQQTLVPQIPVTGPTQSTAAETTLDAINRSLGNTTRDDQGRFFVEMRRAALAGDPHRVVFAEAATGTGKTRAFEAVALDWCAAHPSQRVAIAAPTYGVLLQAVHSLQRIALHRDVPTWVVIAGQREFVSAAALQRVLAEHPDTAGAQAARAWLDAGAKPVVDDPLGHPWLMRSLIEATQGEWILESQVQLDSDVDHQDPGYLAYAAQFEHAEDARIVFCTHAMLAVEARYRIAIADKAFAKTAGKRASDAAWEAWMALEEQEQRGSRIYQLRNDLLRTAIQQDAGRLPEIGLLIVDEAHLLEQAFALIFASGASMARLMRALRILREASETAVHAGDLRKMDDAWEILKRVGGATGAERVNAKDNEAIAEAVAIVRGVVTDVIARAPKRSMERPEIRQLQAIRTALDVAAMASGDRTGLSVRVSWSPTIQWPSIEVGRYDVSRELDFLWNVIVQDCGVLVSATLFDEVSTQGIESMRRMLSVRPKNMVILDPVRPAWLYDPVTLCIVGDATHADGLARFRRPTKRDRLSPEEHTRRAIRWREDVATYIEHAYSSAAGGVLVLLTAHAERAEVAQLLAGRLPDGAVIEQRPDVGIEAMRHRFLEASARGEKPCFIGVGGAWTGLDLSADALQAITGMHVEADEDRVLTDLIIPIAPIGTNRSLTHEWRRKRSGIIAEIGATSITMRQGIGRLVRRSGLPPNRRLHFLDARIHESAWKPLMQPVMRALSPYRTRRPV